MRIAWYGEEEAEEDEEEEEECMFGREETCERAEGEGKRGGGANWEETCERAEGEVKGCVGQTVGNSRHATCGHAAGRWMAS